MKQKKINEVTNHIGDIKSSLLTESQFQSFHGTCWALIKGQSVAGSDYELYTGNSVLPPVGRFLRNTGGNATPLGQTQEDSVGPHAHNFSTGSGTTNSGNAADTDSSNASATTLSTGVGIGIETRPVNISVNMFVKINENCN